MCITYVQKWLCGTNHLPVFRCQELLAPGDPAIKCQSALFLHFGFCADETNQILLFTELEGVKSSQQFPPYFHRGGLAKQRQCPATYALCQYEKRYQFSRPTGE